MEEMTVHVNPMNGEVNVKQAIGPWQAWLTWSQGADPGQGPASVSFRLREGETAPGGLSSTVLRRVDFQRAGELFRKAQPKAEGMTDKRRQRHAERLQWLLKEGVTDRYLALLAFEYQQAVARGNHAPTPELADMAGKRPETIRGHLKEARRRELLTTVKGKAGGARTAKTDEILRGFDWGAIDRAIRASK
ncbi:hypothetical protein Afil01_07740 [Actinorhabdospora filicis]|uniref:Uncharacterized protein n=1 Tax=Actinorhabdospora filicis TaxID=1785913 RepID=A0A9W6W1J4_9ACTN|nr:hypothetical protein [Actinorhabdospora filicis]GLZ75967.1 hypothetical protein Afil01_07740 [Actinorhabdospora filicis]